MDFIELLKNRRSCRKFVNKPVEKEKILTLVQSLLLSPSSRNRKPWEFIVVDDKRLLVELAKSKAKDMGSALIEGAALAIVILGDESIGDIWIEDTTIAAIISQLTAETIGLKSCWVQIRGRRHAANVLASDFVCSLLNIPSSKQVECIIAFGYPNEFREPHKVDELNYEKVFYNKYGSLKE